MSTGWIGVDLDGTLAYYDGWKGIEHIGHPIALMVERVQNWLEEGKDVRVFTARVWPGRGEQEAAIAASYIRSWCYTHIGKVLPVTCEKDFGMVKLYDDRCVQVIANSGLLAVDIL